MTTQVSASEAKSKLAEWLRRAADGEIVLITRHGKPVAALVSAEDVEQLQRLRHAGPQAGLVSLAGGWQGAEALVAQLDAAERSAPRPDPDVAPSTDAAAD
jgi:prevent-host-death family protein